MKMHSQTTLHHSKAVGEEQQCTERGGLSNIMLA